MSTTPKWVTPERQACLVSLWHTRGNKCLRGHLNCSDLEHYIHVTPVVLKVPIGTCSVRLIPTLNAEMTNAYNLAEDTAIKNWTADDRAHARALWELERDSMHDREPRHIRLGRFGTIGREIWHESQPLFYLDGLGISGLTFTPFAIARLPSSNLTLHVDLDDTLKGVSKNRRRKAVRHGKALPHSVQSEIMRLVTLAVQEYYTA